jgi:hypothetical protein
MALGAGGSAADLAPDAGGADELTVPSRLPGSPEAEHPVAIAAAIAVTVAATTTDLVVLRVTSRVLLT